MSDWQTQVDKLLEDYEGITHERYAAGLAAFRAWCVQSYSDEPDAALLTDDEVRDYRIYLTGVKGVTPDTGADGDVESARPGPAHQRRGWPTVER